MGKFQYKQYSKFISEICLFSISREHRGKGHGKRMLSWACQECTTPLILATVRRDNTYWVDTNIKLGFRIIHLLPRPTGDVYVFLKSKQFEWPR